MDAAVRSCFANKDETEQEMRPRLQMFSSAREFSLHICANECGAHTHTHAASAEGAPAEPQAQYEK